MCFVNAHHQHFPGEGCMYAKPNATFIKGPSSPYNAEAALCDPHSHLPTHNLSSTNSKATDTLLLMQIILLHDAPKVQQLTPAHAHLVLSLHDTMQGHKHTLRWWIRLQMVPNMELSCQGGWVGPPYHRAFKPLDAASSPSCQCTQHRIGAALPCSAMGLTVRTAPR